MQLRERKHVKCVQERGTRIQRGRKCVKVASQGFSREFKPTFRTNPQTEQPTTEQTKKKRIRSRWLEPTNKQQNNSQTIFGPKLWL